MTDPIEFETTRLRLRQWRAPDREPFAALNADPSVMEYFPALMDHTASDAMANRCQSLIAERGWGLWAAEAKANHAFIGFVGLNIPTAALPFNPCIEIGWRLACPYWGAGLATEAAKAVLEVGFNQLGLPEIVSFTSLRNLRSQAVMKKLGMRESGASFDYPSIPIGNPLRAHCLYRLSIEQWSESAA
jgi:RimJ/RimL family protein N-acetyltransferase